MSNRTFTWWRRFHSPIKLKKNQMWKGYPQLLQRIEFGEFEYCHLSEECLLEEELYKLEEIEIPNNSSTNLCFGRGRYNKTLFVTTKKKLYSIEVENEGFHLPFKK